MGSRSIIATRLPARPSAHARCSSRTLAPSPPRAPVTARTCAARRPRPLPTGADAHSGSDGGSGGDSDSDSDGEQPERASPWLVPLSPVCVSPPGCTGRPAEGLRGGKETSRPSHTCDPPVAPEAGASSPGSCTASSSGSCTASSPSPSSAGMVSVSSDCSHWPGCPLRRPAGTGACITGISTGIALSFRFPHCLPGPAQGRPLPRPLPQPPPGSPAATPHEWYGGTAAPPPAALHQGAGPPAAAPSGVVGPVETGRRNAPVAPRPPRPTAPHRGPGPPSTAAPATAQATAGLTRLTPELPSW